MLQDIEWARDGDDGKLYIVQARPETVASQKKVGVIEEYKMLEKGRDREPHTLGSLRLGRDMFRFSWDKRWSIFNSAFLGGLLWLVGLVFEWFREGKHEKTGGV